MRVAVTDACIFIDLIELQIAAQFFKLDLEVHTTQEVMNELLPVQAELLQPYISKDKLTVHQLSTEELNSAISMQCPKALSLQDRTVVYLADKLQAMILSSDKPVRKYAGRKSIEYHGVLWLFDRLVEKGLLSKKVAAEKLNELTRINFVFNNNAQLSEEIRMRIQQWTSP